MTRVFKAGTLTADWDGSLDLITISNGGDGAVTITAADIPKVRQALDALDEHSTRE